MVVREISGKINNNNVSFGRRKNVVQEGEAYLMTDERKKHPILTNAKIQTDKFIDAAATYPQKGLKGSKNANFYEFLTMGTVPYLIGSATMMLVFNLAAKFFNTPDSVSSLKNGKRMALGVLGYGLAKTFSKKLVETPVNLKYGIDVNLPYRKKIEELPEESNKTNLIKYEYHKAYESVDFPRWDLLYNNEEGHDRNEYFKSVGKKMGFTDEELKTGADQKVKPLIKEKVIKTKLFSTLSSYLWAGSAVGVAMQDCWKELSFNPKEIIQNVRSSKEVLNGTGQKPYNWFKEFGSTFIKSCKDFVNEGSKGKKIAGRALLGSAILMTAAGIFSTLNDFNNNRGKDTHASTSLFDDSKEKVIC